MKLDKRVIYEDNHMIAINKNSGELSQGDKTGDPTVIDIVKLFLKLKYKKAGNVFAHPVHRLDRPTSGILLFAKTSKALTRLTKAFKNREVQKEYLALVDKMPTKTDGKLSHYLKKNPHKNFVSVSDKPVNGAKRGELSYSVCYYHHSIICLKLKLHTGRSHQIRSQLAHIGIPIIGDQKYRSKSSYIDGAIALHSRSLEFMHPTKKTKLKLVAPLPENKYWNGLELILA